MPSRRAPPTAVQQRKRRVLGEIDVNADFRIPKRRSNPAPGRENRDPRLTDIRRAPQSQNRAPTFPDPSDYSLYQAFPAPTTAPTREVASQMDEEQTSELIGSPDEPATMVEQPNDDDDLEGVDDEDEYFGDYLDDEIEGMAEEYDHDQEDHDDLAGSDDLHESSFDPAALGLKEINNLAHFGVSSHKPGNGVVELLSDDPDRYWQSDGQQPHLLTIHFLRRVEIRAIRFYVDYTQDESYTPTNIVFYAGTSQHDLLQFAEMPLTNPVGWQDVPVAGCGGGHDGNSLSCFVVQMLVKENHQNGKDTHIRGIKIYALDENAVGGPYTTVYEPEQPRLSIADRTTGAATVIDEEQHEEVFDPEIAALLTLGSERKKALQELLGLFDRNPLSGSGDGDGTFSNFPDFMRDPEIR